MKDNYDQILENKNSQELQEVQKYKKQKTIDNYKSKLCMFYISGNEQQIREIKEKEVMMYDGFVPILKLTGDVMEYDNPLWTNYKSTPFQPFI